MPNTHSMPRTRAAGTTSKIALIISVLALCLAFSETFGKTAQTAALNLQIQASNLWNFMQAKPIRRTFTIVQGEAAKIEAATAEGPRKAALEKQIDDWTKTAARYQSEPEAGGGKGEGTRELMRRALEKEKSAISSSTGTITSSSPPRRSRSESCWPRPPHHQHRGACLRCDNRRRPRRRAADGHRLPRAGSSGTTCCTGSRRCSSRRAPLAERTTPPAAPAHGGGMRAMRREAAAPPGPSSHT